MTAKLLGTVLLLLTFITGQTPVSQNGHLQLINNTLSNESGSAIQLRGMSTHGLQYFDDFYTPEAFEGLATGWGADILRISSYVNEGHSSTYLDDPDYWRDRVDQLVEYATDNGMYAMIDWHMLGPGDPNENLAEAKLFWEYMAKKHGAKNNVLFDICNEPNDYEAWKLNENTDEWESDYLGYHVSWSVIKTYADAIVPIIRANDPNNATHPNIIIVGTPDWASSPNDVIGNLIDDDNTMYSMHFYANDGDADPAKTDSWAYMPKFKAAINAGIPLFVTEFGTQDSDGDGANNWSVSQAWLDTLAKYQISWCNWNYSDDHRSGAVFTTDADLYSASDYADSSNLKAAGKWIMDKMKHPADDFGSNGIPTVTITDAPEAVTTNQSPSFSWRGSDDGAIARYYIDFDLLTPTTELSATTTTYTSPTPLPYGSHTFYLRAEDDEGNLSTVVSHSFYVSDGTIPEAEELIINGDFSASIGEEWSADVNGQSWVENGSYTFEIWDGGWQPWDVQLRQGDLPIENGKTYVVTFKAKASSERSMQSTVFSEETYDDYTESPALFELTTTYQEFTYTFTMDAPTDLAATIAFDFGGDDASVWIDDISLMEKVSLPVSVVSTPPRALRTLSLGQGIALSIPHSATVQKITITDLRGRVLYSQRGMVQAAAISSHFKTRGLYVVQVVTSAGVVTGTFTR